MASPLSDPGNDGGWIPFEPMTTDFSSGNINHTDWRTGTGTSWRGEPPVNHDHPASVEVQDGKMLLHFKRRDPADESAGSDVYKYTSGYLVSHMRRRYGYFEIKMKAAVASLTSTFWLHGGSKTYAREIDIFETPSAKPTHLQKMGTNFHSHKNPDPTHGVTKGEDKRPKPIKLQFKPIEAMHTYALEWDIHNCKFYVDGEVVRDVPTQSWKVGMKLMTGLSWNPSFYDEVDESMVPAVMTVEHMRTWIKPPTDHVHFVDLDGSDDNDGTSWDSAFKTIQHAVDHTYDGGQIFVSLGEFPQDISMVGMNQVSLWGGCAKGQPANPEARPRGEKTTIAPLKGPGGRQPLFIASCLDCIVDGFLLTGTRGNFASGVSLDLGYGGTVIRNCNIIGNCPNDGAGAAVSVGSSCGRGHAEFVKCIISDNHTHGKCAWGGAVAINGKEADRCPQVKFKRCTFEGNRSKEHSSCLFMSPGNSENAFVEMLGCGIFNNTHTEHENEKRRVRAAIVVKAGKLVMRDCFVKGNSEMALQVMNAALPPDIVGCHFSRSPKVAVQLKVKMDDGSGCLRDCTFSKNDGGSLWYGSKTVKNEKQIEKHSAFAASCGNKFTDDDEEDPRGNCTA